MKLLFGMSLIRRGSLATTRGMIEPYGGKAFGGTIPYTRGRAVSLEVGEH